MTTRPFRVEAAETRGCVPQLPGQPRDLAAGCAVGAAVAVVAAVGVSDWKHCLTTPGVKVQAGPSAETARTPVTSCPDVCGPC
eukprot:5451465-Amphidinium_carterae.1